MAKLASMPPKTKGQESNSLIARLTDIKDQSDRYHCQTNSAFLTEEELVQVTPWLKKQGAIRIDGGYLGARRCRIAFLYDEDDFVSEVVCLVAKITQKYVQISHRDVLGALMGLNIVRAQFGDIFVLEDKIAIYCTESSAKVVMSQCTQIHQLSITFERSEEPMYLTQQYQTSEINVASMRLDNLVSAIANTSRSEAVKMIETSKVSINHEIVEDCAKLCHNKDTVSIQKVGRFVIEDSQKRTRKERMIIEVKKFL